MKYSCYVCDTFFVIDTTDIAGCADDNTPYSVGKNKYDLERKLQKA